MHDTGAGRESVPDPDNRHMDGAGTGMEPPVMLAPWMAEAARRHLEMRRQRRAYMPHELFGEPAWDMLLDLFIADRESKSISISSACIASGGSATTALRWLTRLEAMSYVERVSDTSDRRRMFVRITPGARDAIALWLSRADGQGG